MLQMSVAIALGTWEHGNMGTGGVESREMAGTRGAGRKHEGLPNGLSCDWHLNGPKPLCPLFDEYPQRQIHPGVC